MENLLERIEAVLGTLTTGGPRGLCAHLKNPGGEFEVASPTEVDHMIDQLLSADPNHPARVRFSSLLRSWDNAKDTKWTAGTPRNTEIRRKRIHELLKSDATLQSRIDTTLPYFPLEEPLIIAEEHRDWYQPQPGIRDYYWTTYQKYLKEKRGWPDFTLLNMENSTRSIVECLADPTAKEAYSSRGLVMGYVQSGKTANFTGVVARAADAGYRLIIVMAGTWNILRDQTQRRFDKELLGKELLVNDQTYLELRPADWPDFLEHGGNPADLGQYTWQRLTRPDIDFRGLKAAIDTLEFDRKDRALPVYAPENLYSLPVKLLVVKKNSGVLEKLAKDLKTIQTKIKEIPALIIDDESDQAGINTIDPSKTVEDGKERTATNKAITQLLHLLPRCQYVGYTATPYANALVRPDDPMDIFPRDFIISLDRPSGYMGVSDFFDPESDYDDLDPNDYSLPEIAFIRRVNNPIGEDDEDLKQALCSYVLAGAVKLFRNAVDSKRYPDSKFKHHTMLIHTSARRDQHAALADRVKELWSSYAFNSPKGKEILEDWWDTNTSRVCATQGANELTPADFNTLIPHISEALSRIQKGPSCVIVINGDSPHNPKFGEDSIWKIFVGGNKLSRGYTIEGLTVSYYRRLSNTGDTLMQMGRWFGFRPGYRDLVRVFLGVVEGKNGREDLVAHFKEVCRTEESFREEIKRYLRLPGVKPITPKEIPPLIAVTGNLLPTAKNKMFNAIISSKNFGGRWSQPTLTPAKKLGMDHNRQCLQKLMASAKVISNATLGGRSNENKQINVDSVYFKTDTARIIEFLTSFQWLEQDYKPTERPTDIGLQIEFLRKAKHGIKSWLVVAPQRRESFGTPLELKDQPPLAVKNRQRMEERGFQQFGEPDIRALAEYIAAVNRPEKKQSDPNEKPTEKRHIVAPEKNTEALRDKHCGVLLIYPARPAESDQISIGFEILYPDNDLGYAMHFTTLNRSGGVVVKTPKIQ